MKNQKVIISSLIIVVLAAGYFVYKNVAKQKTGPALDVATSTVEATNNPDKNTNSSVAGTKTAGKTTPLLARLPDLARPVIILANIAPETETMARAKISELSKELGAEPGLFGNWLDLASYRKLIGDNVGAEEIWLFMTKQWPDHDVPYINLGNFYHYQTHDFAKSEAAFRKAISVKPNSIPPYIGLYELYALSYAEKAGLADDILIEGLKNNPKNILLLSTLAEYYTGQGDITSAKKYYQEALDVAMQSNDTKLQDQLKQRISGL
ncbi:MAG: hypothetical protein HZC04_00405 [Candidatus Lloydbacteria bacterium]|nr:hypothetical protein [Candidatus Lloydbacteria bacterium]